MDTAGDEDTAREPLRLVHHHPGRLRMRAHAFLGDGAHALVAHVMTGLDAVPGIGHVTHNPRTGGLLVEYQPGLAEPDAILARVVEVAGLSRVVLDGADQDHRGELIESVMRIVRGLNTAAREMTGGRADLRELVPAALLATSLYSLVTDRNGPRLPRWDNALNWSYAVFMDWHRRAIETRVDGESSHAP